MHVCMQAAFATLPDSDIQKMVKKYPSRKAHTDDNNSEPGQEHEIKLGIVHAANSKKPRNFKQVHAVIGISKVVLLSIQLNFICT